VAILAPARRQVNAKGLLREVQAAEEGWEAEVDRRRSQFPSVGTRWRSSSNQLRMKLMWVILTVSSWPSSCLTKKRRPPGCNLEALDRGSRREVRSLPRVPLAR